MNPPCMLFVLRAFMGRLVFTDFYLTWQRRDKDARTTLRWWFFIYFFAGSTKNATSQFLAPVGLPWRSVLKDDARIQGPGVRAPPPPTHHHWWQHAHVCVWNGAEENHAVFSFSTPAVVFQVLMSCQAALFQLCQQMRFGCCHSCLKWNREAKDGIYIVYVCIQVCVCLEVEVGVETHPLSGSFHGLHSSSLPIQVLISSCRGCFTKVWSDNRIFFFFKRKITRTK